MLKNLRSSIRLSLIEYRDMISIFFVNHHNYILTALLWRISLRKIKKNSTNFSKKKVIILSRAGGNEDVQNALKNAIKPCSYYLFPRSLVKHIFAIYLDGLVSDADYRSSSSEIKNHKVHINLHVWFC